MAPHARRRLIRITPLLLRPIVVVSSSPGFIRGLVAVSFQSIYKRRKRSYIGIAEIRTYDLPHPSKYASIYPQDHGALAVSLLYIMILVEMESENKDNFVMWSTLVRRLLFNHLCNFDFTSYFCNKACHIE